MKFNEMVKMTKRRQYSPFQGYGHPILAFPEGAMEDFIRDYDDGWIKIYDSAVNCLSDIDGFEWRYAPDGTQEAYINPLRYDDGSYESLKIKLRDGRVVCRNDMARARKIDLNEVVAIHVTFDEGWGVFGNVAILIDEDLWLEDVENGVPQGQRTMVYGFEFL